LEKAAGSAEWAGQGIAQMTADNTSKTIVSFLIGILRA
jgi:hypothetical protein